MVSWLSNPQAGPSAGSMFWFTWKRLSGSYRSNYDRLSQVKRRYDPDNLFHVNQNIEPAEGPA